MTPPNIDYIATQRTLELAEELLATCSEDLSHQEFELETADKELRTAEALVSLVKRNDSRSKVLKDCGEYGSLYSAQIDGVDLEQCQQFVHTLRYRATAFQQRVDQCNQAISLLRNDISDLRAVLETPFYDRYKYLAVIGSGPGAAFFIYRPVKWLEKWMSPPVCNKLRSW
ncbi:hypothetical protein BBI10_00350 [Pseudomonas graminis]|uniref:Uncharacterized protein n=1 Tax=Pseudomonas graminis TaxID=158627 RepID=A0A1C2EFW2_9PSED|nr:hypothetical protein BBI10_00350 [Pseudomonas graminis]